MASAESLVSVSSPLVELVGRLDAVAGFNDVVAALQAGEGATLDGVWGSSCALAAAALLRHAPAGLVLVTPHASEVDDLVDDLRLFTETRAERFPAWESLPSDRVVRDEVFADRLRVLKHLAAGPQPRLIVTSIQALSQPVPTRGDLLRQTRTLRTGDEADVTELLTWLVEHRFQNMTAVELPGEFTVHGGIIDIFPVDSYDPVRIELFGDHIESIRRFDVSSQRSLAALEAIDITVVDPRAPQPAHLADHLAPNTWFLLIEPSKLEESGRQYLARLDQPADFHTVSDTLRRVYKFPSATAEGIAGGSFETGCHLKIESVERFTGDVAHVREELQGVQGQRVVIVCSTEAEVKRLRDLFGSIPLAAQGRLDLIVGRLREGFRFVPAQILVLSSSELFQRSDAARPAHRHLGRTIDSFLDLREGDYVVHVSHGIARYLGLRLLENAEQVEEHLELEFHGGTKIYVPTSRIELVQKYVGGTKMRPQLAKIGGRSWVRQKQSAQQAVTDLAGELLTLQATRAARPGISFPLDTEWQNEFDAAFPYEETKDQLDAVEAIKRDMHLPRPMDRLICGDVGYGKTEVAMRAVFKAVESGYQVAVLVPTTVLAEQHRRTFSARMAEYPFEIAALSRFLTDKQQRAVIERLATGEIDVVIGTHRLVQPDIHFHNLGLVVIDEEQRFGVQAKERLKTLRQIVDVLTLTATPIPRTLHMSLLGLRDISNLTTPPEDRLSVETRVTRFDADLIRHAVLRELNRDGQIFFVHNRIYDIEGLAGRLRQIVPEASIQVAHGQMPEGQLERVMLDFVNHKFDMLLSTTIIESGLDIPNANTIFIDQADHYGLADLHQLRGRVGRYKHRAYCYLLIDPNQSLSSTAAKRLRAIEEFSQIGAGFAIAMRDLEIRGAGNILGTEQSGHIAAVGYELYCQLLEQVVCRLKNLPERQAPDVNIQLPGRGFIPRSYVPDMRTKIDLYRRLSRVATEAELAELWGEILDRFGPAPPPVEWLKSLTELRLLAARWSIDAIRLEENYLVFGYRARPQIEELSQLSGRRLRIADGQSAYLPLGKDVRDSVALHNQAKSLLRAGAGADYTPAPRQFG